MIKVLPYKRTISPEKAISILAKHGEKVTLAEAKLILDFMYNFVILSVNQTLKDKRMKEL